MPTAYPDGLDSFSVTSLPEDTPLSQAGPGATRNHPELEEDQGDAIEALEVHAAQKTHDHSGDSADTKKGAKLAQANTHQSADTDAGNSSIHHTLGTGQYQAAKGNHAHANLTICTSGTRPGSPALGNFIYETDTQRLYVWIGSWLLVVGGPAGPAPTCRLKQSIKQQVSPSGTIIQWTHEAEDNNNFWTSGAATDIVVRKAGLYLIQAAVQWDSEFVPDIAHVIVTQNGVETTIRESRYIRGAIFTPGFSQTISVQGSLRCEANDVLRLKAAYTGSGLLGTIFTFFDDESDIKSRIDVTWAGA